MSESEKISLMRSSESSMISAPTEEKKSRGVSLHIYDSPELPLEEEQLNKKMKAEIEFIPREVSVSETNGKKRYSYDLEITSIEI